MQSYVYWKNPSKRFKAYSNISNKSYNRSKEIDLTFAWLSCIYVTRKFFCLFYLEEKTLYPLGIPNRKKICWSVPQETWIVAL